jgi:hypothetical protein
LFWPRIPQCLFIVDIDSTLLAVQSFRNRPARNASPSYAYQQCFSGLCMHCGASNRLQPLVYCYALNKTCLMTPIPILTVSRACIMTRRKKRHGLAAYHDFHHIKSGKYPKLPAARHKTRLKIRHCEKYEAFDHPPPGDTSQSATGVKTAPNPRFSYHFFSGGTCRQNLS